MLLATVPVIVALVGLLLYAFGPGRASEVGRLLFFAGVLVALSAYSHAGMVRVP